MEKQNFGQFKSEIPQDFTKPLENDVEIGEPNIDSADNLLAKLGGLEEGGNYGAKVELVEEIKEKLKDLDMAQRSFPDAQNVRNAIVKLRDYLQKLSN